MPQGRHMVPVLKGERLTVHSWLLKLSRLTFLCSQSVRLNMTSLLQTCAVHETILVCYSCYLCATYSCLWM